MSGDPLSAREAAEWGMIWRAVPDHDLLETARSFANKLTTKGPLSFHATKQALAASWHNDFAAQLNLERDNQQMLGYSEDYTEGVTAFREKRATNFTGS